VLVLSFAVFSGHISMVATAAFSVFPLQDYGLLVLKDDIMESAT